MTEREAAVVDDCPFNGYWQCGSMFDGGADHCYSNNPRIKHSNGVPVCENPAHSGKACAALHRTTKKRKP